MSRHTRVRVGLISDSCGRQRTLATPRWMYPRHLGRRSTDSGPKSFDSVPITPSSSAYSGVFPHCSLLTAHTICENSERTTASTAAKYRSCAVATMAQ